VSRTRARSSGGPRTSASAPSDSIWPVAWSIDSIGIATRSQPSASRPGGRAIAASIAASIASSTAALALHSSLRPRGDSRTSAVPR